MLTEGAGTAPPGPIFYFFSHLLSYRICHLKSDSTFRLNEAKSKRGGKEMLIGNLTGGYSNNTPTSGPLFKKILAFIVIFNVVFDTNSHPYSSMRQVQEDEKEDL